MGISSSRFDVAALGYKFNDIDSILAEDSVRNICVDPHNIDDVRGKIWRGQSARPPKISSVISFPTGTSEYGSTISRIIVNALANGTHEVDIPFPLTAIFPVRKASTGGIANDPRLQRWLAGVPNLPRLEKYKIILHTDFIESLFWDGREAKDFILQLAGAIRLGLLDIESEDKLYMKTCTGFGPGKAEPSIVAALVAAGHRVKASGGIRTRDDLISLNQAGAEIFGVSYGAYKNLLEEGAISDTED